jgi:transcriptional regulator with GAF, ATPase, and Fis domain
LRRSIKRAWLPFETGSLAMVFDRLDERAEYADVIAALRGFGQQSACLLPLATALGPVGLIAFASSREGTYSQCDTSFLRHIGALVAMAIDTTAANATTPRHRQSDVSSIMVAANDGASERVKGGIGVDAGAAAHRPVGRRQLQRARHARSRKP